MNAKTYARYKARANVLKALAHPARLLIVDELAHGEPRCVCELTKLVGADISTVSRHLAMLKNAGIVEDEKRGTQVYYRLCICCVPEFIQCVEAVLQRNAKKQQRLLVS